MGEEVSIKERESLSVMITVIKDGRKATLSIADDDVGEIRSRLEAVCKTLPFVTPDEDVSVPDIRDSVDADDRRFDYSGVTSENLSAEFEKIRGFRYPEGVLIESFSFEVEESERMFVNSHGAAKRYAKSASHWGVELFLPTESGGDAWYDSLSFPEFVGVDEKTVKEVSDRLLAMSSPVEATFASGTATVALESGVFSEFLDILCGAVTAENVRQKTTFLERSDLGKPLLPKGFSLRSAARLPDSAYGRLFDGEGITTEDLDVVSDGIWKNFFSDSKNAKKFDIPTTGNPGPSNLVFEAPVRPEALTEANFLFTNLMAFHTVDSISGKFALEGEGFELKNGKPVGYVKNVALSGNVKDLFANLVAETGNRRRHGNVVTGDVVVSGLSVNV
ncbi:MAG: PmbA protein [Patescibacteria group bacterium]|nr:PmbA protein [Patescibacteria group bacterium]